MNVEFGCIIRSQLSQAAAAADDDDDDDDDAVLVCSQQCWLQTAVKCRTQNNAFSLTQTTLIISLRLDLEVRRRNQGQGLCKGSIRAVLSLRSRLKVFLEPPSLGDVFINVACRVKRKSRLRLRPA